MLRKYSLKALQKAINRALALDETTPVKIASLNGKVLEIIITPLEVKLFMKFVNKELQLLADYDGYVDTVIQSSPMGLIRLSFLPASNARSLFNDKIRVIGDVEFGQQVKKLFDELDIDWEGHLAHFTGDMIAHQVGCLFRQGIAFKNQFTSSMRQNFIDYLQEEQRLLPTSQEVEDLFADIDKLSIDMERLQACVNQLTTNHEIH